jgi:DinB superfamily
MSIFSNRMSDAKTEAGAYTRAVLGLLGDRDPLTVLESLDDQVTRVVSGFDEARLAAPETPGKWSALRVLRHLVDSELVWAIRLRKVVAEDRPVIQGYDQDLWADRLHYDRQSPADVRADLVALRRLNLRFLRGLDSEELKRFGVHSERGDESVGHMIRLYAGHDLLHLRQLRRILGRPEA